MRRFRLWVSYDGTNYHGFQQQEGANTIEGCLNAALTDLFGEPICVIGASRTDAGVHALSNVAVFDAKTRMPGEKICLALNQRLPEDIKVWKSEEVEADFHPRHCQVQKTYEYRICHASIPNPLKTRYAHFTYLPLSVEKMKAAASTLVGEHDFSSFCAAGAQTKTMVRTILDATVYEEGEDIIVISLTGTGFLYNMVRIIAGTLLEVGAGKRDASLTEVIQQRNRKAAGPTAPPQGLVLKKIIYC